LLEVRDRFGVAHRMIDTGVAWNAGKIFCGEEMLYRFDDVGV
jgi:hypothetical protein